MKLLRLHSCHNDLSPVTQVPVLAVFPSVHRDGVEVGVGWGGGLSPPRAPAQSLHGSEVLSSSLTFCGAGTCRATWQSETLVHEPPSSQTSISPSQTEAYHCAVKPNCIGTCLWEHWLSGDPNGKEFFKSAEPSAVLLWMCPDIPGRAGHLWVCLGPSSLATVCGLNR